MWWFSVLTHWERIPSIDLICPSPYIFICFFFKKGSTFTFYSISKFYLHSIVFISYSHCEYIRSSDLTHLITESCCPFTNLFLFSLTPSSSNIILLSVSMSLTFFFFKILHLSNTVRYLRYLSFSVKLVSLSMVPSRFILSL